MLKNLNPLLGPDLLHVLRSMGHHQDIAIVDANFPSDPAMRLIRLDGVSAPDAIDAILSVFPVERNEPDSAWRMIADDDPETILPIFSDMAAVLERHEPGLTLTPIAPSEFAARVSTASAAVITGEARLYGGAVFRMGAVAP